MKIAVFADRDGTLIEEIGYLSDPSQIKLIKGAAEGVKLLNDAGITVVIVTNQSGVARGMFPEEKVFETNDALVEMLASHGARIDAIYFCPHHPTEGEPSYRMDCECRKPRPGLVFRAAEDLDIDVSSSFVIGDKDSDIELAANGGCAAAVLVLTGYGPQQQSRSKAIDPSPKRIHISKDFIAAANWIIEQVKRNSDILIKKDV